MIPILKNTFCAEKRADRGRLHHKKPRKGNLTLFHDPSNLKAVCWSCHLDAIQSEKAFGYAATIGAHGWPVDDKYPTTKNK